MSENFNIDDISNTTISFSEVNIAKARIVNKVRHEHIRSWNC